MDDHSGAPTASGSGQVLSYRILPTPFPAYLGGMLETATQNVFCTLASLAEAPVPDDRAAYLAYTDARLSTIVVYRRDKRRITVLGELVDITTGQLERMVRDLLESHPGVSVVCLPSVMARGAPLSLPSQRVNATEDMVISLPATPEAYLASLGPNTRAAIRRAQRLVAAQHPDLVFDACDKGRTGAQRIGQLVELSRLRIEGKTQVSAHSADSVARLTRMIDAYGCTLLASAGGQVCAGVACTRVGAHVYMHVIAHRQDFDAVRLGMLCCYLSICDAIRRGAREYHLLSGRYDYKRRLLGQQRDFERIVVYRSLTGLAANLDLYTRVFLRAKGRLAKQRYLTWRKKWTH